MIDNGIIDNDNSFSIPLIDFKLPAGFQSPAQDYLEERINIARELVPRPLSTFYAYCEGDSMIEAHITPNSILVIDKSLEARSGDVVVAYLNGGWTVKYIKFQSDKCWLIPANKKYSIIEVTEEMAMIVWGVVTNVIINTKYIKLCSP